MNNCSSLKIRQYKCSIICNAVANRFSNNLNYVLPEEINKSTERPINPSLAMRYNKPMEKLGISFKLETLQ